jgi:hypothetical protein
MINSWIKCKSPPIDALEVASDDLNLVIHLISGHFHSCIAIGFCYQLVLLYLPTSNPSRQFFKLRFQRAQPHLSSRLKPHSS